MMTDGDVDISSSEEGGTSGEHSTIRSHVVVSVSGIENPERAHEFAAVVGAYSRALGTVFDLGRLEGITASDDYPSALASIERGFGAERAPVRSENIDMLGVAMSVHVMRDGEVRSHLVFDIEGLLPLCMCEPDSEEARQARYMLAHECAHVEDLKLKDEAFPGVILRPREVGWIELNLGPAAWGLWEEYFACRRAAGFDPSQTQKFAAVLLSCLDHAQEEVDAAIRAYRLHHDLPRLVSETAEPGTRVMRAAAYLYGHLDGLDLDWDAVPDVRERLDGHTLAPLLDEMSEELERLWASRGAWKSYDEFSELLDIVRDAFEVAGIDAQERPDGSAYLNVPFRPSTT